MKQIQPVSIWYNGQMVQATILNMASISDNLSTSATFLYQLLSADNIALTNGNLIMEGTDYVNYWNWWISYPFFLIMKNKSKNTI